MTTSIARRNLLSDTRLIAARELRPAMNDPFSLVVGLVQPLFFLLLFGPLLDTGNGSSWEWFIPGVLVMAALFGTAGAGSNLQMDLVSGTHERLLVSPMARPALFLGKSLKEFVPLIAQAVVVILIMLPFGFRPHPVGAFLGLLLLGILGLGIGSLSYALALAVRDQDWLFWTVHQTVLFPLMILSGMLLPLDTAPAWMRVLSAANPLTHVVNAERELFAGHLTSGSLGWGVLAALITATLGALLGLRALTNSTR
mgnify:CR=1 FL=1